jgi:hypothetical protein
MARSIEQIRKIIALLDDAGTDEATRAVCLARLIEARKENPELFPDPKRAAPSPSSPPQFHDVDDDDEADDFFDPDNWNPSSNNPENLVRMLAGGAIVTVFRNPRRPDRWSWSVSRKIGGVRGEPIYSQASHATARVAMRDCWLIEISPARRRRP